MVVSPKTLSVGVLCTILAMGVVLSTRAQDPPHLALSDPALTFTLEADSAGTTALLLSNDAGSAAQDLAFSVGLDVITKDPIQDTVGSPSTSWGTSFIYYGNVYEVTTTTRLMLIESYLRVPDMLTALNFVVCESDSVNGVYTLLESQMWTASGDGWVFHASLPMDVRMEAGRFYLIAVGCASPSATAAYDYAPQPRPVSFGSQQTGVFQYGFPIGPTVSISGNSANPYQRLTTVRQWLSVSPAAGSIPADTSSTLTVTADTTSMSVGSHYANMIVSNNDPDHNPTTIPVTLRVRNDSLFIDPIEDILMQGFEGGPFSPQSGTCTLANVGSGVLDWATTPSQPWLEIAPQSGTLAQGATTQVNMSLNSLASSLPWSPSPYSATTSFMNPVSGVAQSRSVQLMVAQRPPDLSVNRDSMTIFLEPNKTWTEPLVVGNAALASAANLALFVNSQSPWGVQAVDTFGTASHYYDFITYIGNVYGVTTSTCLSSIESYLGFYGPQPLHFVVFASQTVTGIFTRVYERTVECVGIGPAFYRCDGMQLQLAAGTYYMIVVGGPDTVVSCAWDDTTAPFVSFGFYNNGIDLMYYPYPVGTSVQNNGRTYNRYRQRLTTGQAWLTVTPASSNVSPGTSKTLALKVDSTNMPVGGYSGSVILSSNDPDESPTTVPVRLELKYDDLVVDPLQGFASGGDEWGPFTPKQRTYSVSNTGSATLTWTTTTSQPWLEVIPGGGLLDPGELSSATVRLNSLAEALPWSPSPYQANAVFTNLVSATSHLRSVQLTVRQRPPDVSAIPTSLPFVLEPGMTGEQSVTIANCAQSGAANLAYSGTTGPPSQNWLSVAPAGGSVFAGTSATLTVRADATSVSLGSHVGTLTIASNDPDDSRLTIPVTLKVRIDDLFIDPVQVFSSAGFETGPFTPSLKTYSLSNLGTYTLDWASSATAAWLDVVPSAGSLAPGESTTVTVTINATANSLAWSPSPYLASVTFVNVTGGVTQSLPVELMVSQMPPRLSLSPPSFSFRLAPGTVGFDALEVGNAALLPSAKSLEFSIRCTSPWASPTTDTVGSTQNLSYGGMYYIGNVYEVTSTTVLTKIESYVWLGSQRTLHFVVFECATPDGVYERIFEQTVQRSRVGPAFYSSDPISLLLETGKYYIIAAGDRSSLYDTAGFYVEFTASDPVVSFGCCVNAWFHSGFTIGSVITNPNLANRAAHQRLTTIPSWLSVDTSTGNLSPGTTTSVSIRAEATNAPPGEYNGQLVITSNDPDDSPATVPVSLNVMPDDLHVEPLCGFEATGPEEGPFAPASESYALSNVGLDTIDWTSTSSQPWLAITPSRGSLAPGESTTVSVLIGSGANSLPWNPSSYRAKAIFTRAGSGMDQSRYVELNVVQKPADLWVAPGNLVFTLYPDTAGVQSLELANGAPPGNSSLEFSVVADCLWDATRTDTAGGSRGPYWRSYGYVGNTYEVTTTTILKTVENYLSFSDNQTLQFVVLEASEPNGIYTRVLSQTVDRNGTGARFYASDELNLPLIAGKYYTIAVGYYGSLNAYYDSRVQPYPVSFGQQISGFDYYGYPVGHATPPYASIYDYRQRITTSDGWLSVVPESGTVGPGTTTTLAVRADATSVPQGIHAAQLIISSNDPDENPTTVPVTLRVRVDDLLVQPVYAFSASGEEGGPFSPPQMTYTLTNLGTVALDWASSRTEPWLDITPAKGSVAPGDVTTISVSINSSANLLLGNASPYIANANFTSLASGIMQPREVLLSIAQRPPAISVEPNALSFALFPDTVGQQALVLGNTALTAAADLDFSVASGAAPWLSTEPAMGSIAAVTTTSITVRANTTGMTVGTYQGVLTISSNDPDNSHTTVSVRLVVKADDLYIDPVPGFPASGYERGPFTPSNRIYELSNVGTVALDWATSASQPWLEITPSAGSIAPGEATTVSVGFNAGTNSLLWSPTPYLATADFTNLSDGITQQRNVQLAVAQRPPDLAIDTPPLTFTLSQGSMADRLLVLANEADVGAKDLAFSVSAACDAASTLQDNVGNTTESWGADNVCCGNVYQVTGTTRLTRVETYLAAPAGITLNFVVYESTSLNGTYNRLVIQSVGTGSGGTRFYASNPMNISLEAGRFYLVATAWGSYWIITHYDYAAQPRPVSFGYQRTGFFRIGDPLGPTITPSDNAANVCQRITTERPMLSVSPSGGTASPGTSFTLTVHADAANRPPGQTHGDIVISSNDPDEDPTTVPVTIVVDPVTDTWDTEAFSQDITSPAAGATTGWAPLSDYQVGQQTDYDDLLGALRVTISSGTGAPRINGWVSANSEWMPYPAAGADSYVRAKFHIFRSRQADPGNLNEVPNMRLRVSARFAMTSMLEVFNHLSGDDAGTSAGRDLVPSSDATSASVFRVDFAPLDVPAMSDTQNQGISRAFEAYSLEDQENGALELAESMIGYYPALAVPDTGPLVLAVRTFRTSASDAGDLKVHNSVTDGPFLRKYTLVSPGWAGSEVALDGVGDPFCTESADGVTLDTTALPSNRVGIVTREFTGVGADTERIRVAPQRQYKVLWHITSNTNANTNPQLRLHVRALKFMWSQKLELGGALAAGSHNNTLAAQVLPGIGCMNPNQRAPGEPGGWYTLLMHTPMSTEIQLVQPYLAGQPPPGLNQPSIRDVKLAIDVIDTLSGSPSSRHEAGRFTLDQIDLGEYQLIED